MRHDRSLAFDDLEARKLLSGVHAAHKPAAVALALSGTLAVNQKQASTTEDMYGDNVKTTPVSGVLAGLGAVKGTWTEEDDYYGDMVGVDTVRLKGPRGSFTVSFDPTRLGKEHPVAGGQAFAAIPQSVQGGSGTFAHAVEKGTLVLTTNAAKSAVESMTLATNPTAAA